MSTLTSTMSASSTLPPQPAGSGFPRKIVLLILLEIAAALGYYLLVRPIKALPLLGANLLAIGLLGMVAGFGTRTILRQRNWFVRYLSGIAALIIGLFLLGVLTHWLIGLGPLVLGRRFIDWISLGKIGLGAISFFLSMQAWSKPAPALAVSASVTPASVPARAPAKTPSKASAKAPRRASRSRIRPKRKTSKPTHFPAISPKGKPAAAKKAAHATTAGQPVSKPVTNSRRSLFRHKPQVRLSKIERHLCPYCLEPVTRNDARGVVECDICHTLHHGDCWAIAGSCQVPHFTS